MVGELLGWGAGTHPCPWPLCVFQERKLCAHPRIEIYKQDRIYFVCPLARQGDFYVPEMKELERKSRAAAAVAEDAQTDITGICGLCTGSIFISPHRGGVLVSPVLLPGQRGTGLCPPGIQPESQHTSSPHPVPLPLTPRI